MINYKLAKDKNGNFILDVLERYSTDGWYVNGVPVKRGIMVIKADRVILTEKTYTSVLDHIEHADGLPDMSVEEYIEKKTELKQRSKYNDEAVFVDYEDAVEWAKLTKGYTPIYRQVESVTEYDITESATEYVESEPYITPGRLIGRSVATNYAEFDRVSCFKDTVREWCNKHGFSEERNEFSVKHADNEYSIREYDNQVFVNIGKHYKVVWTVPFKESGALDRMRAKRDELIETVNRRLDIFYNSKFLKVDEIKTARDILAALRESHARMMSVRPYRKSYQQYKSALSFLAEAIKMLEDELA